MPSRVQKDQEEIVGAKMVPEGPGGTDGCQDGSIRTRRWVPRQGQQRRQVPRWGQMDQGILDARVCQAGPGAADGR